MFWTQFKNLCTERGMSPNAVAAELGIPSGSITAWNKGACPRQTTIKRIADYFGVTPQYLLYGEAETKKDTTPQGGVELDNELREIWSTADEEERRVLLDMARMLKSRRGK